MGLICPYIMLLWIAGKAASRVTMPGTANCPTGVGLPPAMPARSNSKQLAARPPRQAASQTALASQ